MKRSAPLQRKTPLKRGSWKSSPVESKDWRQELRSGGMKRRVKRPTVAEGSKFLAACRGEPCYLRVAGVCALNPADDTVVPCHSNLQMHGAGKGIKAHHRFTFPACGACHFWLDQSKVPTKEHRREATLVALEHWVPVRAKKMGLTEGDICAAQV